MRMDSSNTVECLIVVLKESCAYTAIASASLCLSNPSHGL